MTPKSVIRKMGNIVHMPRRRTARNDATTGAAAGTAAAGAAAEPTAKKSRFGWLKWIAIGAGSAIVGYEGLRLWKKVKGDEGGQSTERNPEAAAAMPPNPFANMSLPQVVPLPLPIPQPMYAPPMYPPQAPAAPEPPARNNSYDDDGPDEMDETVILAKAKEIRRRRREESAARAMAAMEAFDSDDD